MTLEEVLRIAAEDLTIQVQVGKDLSAEIRANSYNTERIDSIVARFGAQIVFGLAADPEAGLIVQAREP